VGSSADPAVEMLARCDRMKLLPIDGSSVTALAPSTAM
jgi:hypothetical protein